mgnify:FL=1
MSHESWKKLFPWKRTTTQARPPSERLEGELVVLRAKLFSDVDRDYAWRSDPELAELDATTPIRLWLDEYGRHYRDEINYPSPWSVRYAIETNDGVHIGNAMYYDIDRSKSQCELGIMIGDRDYWSHGYGTDAILTLLRSIFEEQALDRVYLHTLAYNERAQKSFRKSGFNDLESVHRDRRDFLKMEVFSVAWFEEFGGSVEQPEDDPQTADESQTPGATGAADPG